MFNICLAVSSCQFLLNLLVPFPLQAKKEQQDKVNQINNKETYHNCYRSFLPINGNQTKPIQYLKRDTSTILSFQIWIQELTNQEQDNFQWVSWCPCLPRGRQKPVKLSKSPSQERFDSIIEVYCLSTKKFYITKMTAS